MLLFMLLITFVICFSLFVFGCGVVFVIDKYNCISCFVIMITEFVFLSCFIRLLWKHCNWMWWVMAASKVPYGVILLCFFLGTCLLSQCFAIGVDANQTARLFVNASQTRPMPDTLFGIFFEVSYCLSCWNISFS